MNATESRRSDKSKIDEQRGQKGDWGSNLNQILVDGEQRPD